MSDNNSNNGVLTQHMVLNKTRANSLSDIKAINLWGFNLRDVSIFKSMPNIEIVSMPMNNISTLKQFVYCSNLKELLLRQNSISSFSEIEYLSNLKNLERLWLADNPICQNPNYRKKVISILPQLLILDEIPINDDERYGNSQQRNFENSKSGLYHDNNQAHNHSNTCNNKRLLNSDYRRQKNHENQNKTGKNPYLKSDEAQLTAVLALLPSLNPDSLSIVLDSISDLTRRY